MVMPGFSAETSLYKTTRHYCLIGAFHQTVDTLQLQACDQNRLRECLNECGNPDPDNPHTTAQCRHGCYLAFGQCTPPPPPPVNCGTFTCPPGSTCCGSMMCCRPGAPCCLNRGCGSPGSTCCGTGTCPPGSHCDCGGRGCCPDGQSCLQIGGLSFCSIF